MINSLRRLTRNFLYGDIDHQIPVQEIIVVSLGLFFLAFGLFAMVFGASRGKLSWALWSCYIAMVLIGVGALRKNSFLVVSQVNILAIPLIGWNIDFFYQLIFKQELWGVTNYFFESLLPVARFISLEHFFIVPVGLYLIYLLKLEKKGSWKLSFITLALTFIVTIIFTPPELNVNCGFESCISFLPTQFYPTSYLVLLFSLAFITSTVLERTPLFIKK